MIHKLSNLPCNGLVSDFSGIDINQFVEFSTFDFTDTSAFDLQIEHIKDRAKELNAKFEVYLMGENKLLMSYNYLMQFKSQ